LGIFDILRGQRAPKRANLDNLFALTTARTTLSVSLGYEPLASAAVCLKPVEAAGFGELRRDLDELLALNERTAGTRCRHEEDEFGFLWLVLEDEDFDDLVTTAHLVNQTLEERGFSEQLLCSVFGFHPAEGPDAFFVYAYKRGTFYPFVPVPGEDRRRDNPVELRLKAALGRELPIEPELERWYPVWGAPLR
jgi:PspAB-like protein